MWSYRKVFSFIKSYQRKSRIFSLSQIRHNHRMPFLDFYHKTTGESLSENALPDLKRKHPNIATLTDDSLQYTLQILEKFGISHLEACQNLHLLSMNPIAVDNYAEILKECGFVRIKPQHIIRYHTLVRSRTIAELKKEGLMKKDFNLEERLMTYFQEWPPENKILQHFADSNTTILNVRLSVLGKYLHWRIKSTPEDFHKYCKNYLPLKHKPMSDIKEALNLAQNTINFDVDTIRRNGFIISTDPIKTKMILEYVDTLAGLDIKEAIRLEPGLLKNNYKALLEVGSLLEEYRIPIEAQQRCLRIFCMKAQTVKERLDELRELKEYQVLATNPRVLTLVVHKKKMLSRLGKIQAAKKPCYSLNNLVSSSKVFNNYITSFGNKVCGRDIAILIGSAVQGNSIHKQTEAKAIREVVKKLKRHKYWLHAALNVVDENIRFLKTKFDNDTILDHCQILLYPISEVEYYLDHLLKLRKGEVTSEHSVQLDSTYNNLKYSELTDNHILSLVLYEIEKKYHFSGDGIWAHQEPGKADSQRA